MPAIVIDQFSGEVPRLPADRLPIGGAQKAINCDFSHGELRMLRDLGPEWVAHESARPVRSVFTDNGLRFFAWDKPTRAFLAPTIDDTAGRVYFQTHGQPLRVATTSDMRLSSLEPRPPTASWKVGVRSPALVTAELVGELPEDDLETVSVVATAQNIWGEESAPTAPILVKKGFGQHLTLTAEFEPDSDQQTIHGINFYRTYGTAPDHFLINEIPVAVANGAAVAIDVSASPATTTALLSAQWDEPPELIGSITYAGNGFFAAATGKDVIFCEPYRPHAWPYRMTFPHGVVGLVSIEGGVLVATQAQAYLVSGAHPTQMSQRLLPAEQAGWSDTAMARVQGAAVYASNDGIVDVFGGQPSIKASQQLFTRKDWRARYGDTRLNLRLAHHDGYLLGIVDPSYPLDVTAPSFLLRLDEADGSLCTLDLGRPIYGASISGTTDQLFVGTDTGFREFVGGEGHLTGSWHSGDIRFPRPMTFAAVEIDCSGTFEVEFYAAGALIHTRAVTGKTDFRLPAVSAADSWSVRITGAGVVRMLAMGASFQELQAA